MKVKKNYETGEVTLEFGDAGTVEFNVNDFSDEIKAKLSVYGAVAKVSRATAGKASDDSAAYKAASNVVEQLKAGSWTAQRPSTKDIQANFLLAEIRALDPDLRPEFVEALRKTGTFEKLGISEDDIQAAINA